ncbi:YgfZ/GcvT domain-containing protein [Legionella brunensis]|uniref:Glycine cleavage T protein n=1 Tax=Legionella brunensis TaxID=29422 RepID=A0A0W0SUS0_9GAMM|nr:folate-binding protein YgfZ [Legionella brunensis]KTC86693.1 glycine cleavage T protein [Legionella brunensis]
MTSNNYLINHRPYTYTLSLSSEFIFQNDKNYLFELANLGILSIVGEGAQEFLQGQLTCDLRQVTINSMRQGAQCNLKGRILTLLDVIYWHHFQLILPSDLFSETQNSLTKTAMLSRVKIEPNHSCQIFGFYLNNPRDILPFDIELPAEQFSVKQTEEFVSYCLGDNLYILVAKKEKAEALVNPFRQTAQYRGSLAWHYLQLSNKQLQIYPETRGLFLPHRLDLHLSNHISFEKGCYKGQEIIARTHYKAKLKHGLRLFTIESKEPLFAGKKLFDLSGKKEVGELIDFCPLGNDHSLIAVSILLEYPPQIRIEDQLNDLSLVTA